MERIVIVDGQPKGEVCKNKRGRWTWHRGGDGPGTETYHKRAVLADVRAHIARVCRAKSVILKTSKGGAR